MNSLRQTINTIDTFTQRVGHMVAWLLVLLVLMQGLVVLLRYGFSWGSIALQESVTYLHAICFMLGAAFTLQVDRHVRVDVLYRSMSLKQQALVNAVGSVLFLIPICLFMLWTSYDYVLQAWTIKERSADSGGLAIVYLLKTLIPLLAISLLAQALAELGRSILSLTDRDVGVHHD
ncbi:MAG: TRAP transporter small permease subunit [Pseudomonadales bacterium]|nr:TRAP transporter small permease subunit [Pseudomonadales bacterium]